MAVVETRYAVPGWGIGEIWLGDGVLLAHDFHFETAAAAPRVGSQARRSNGGGARGGAPQAAPLEGAHGPPSGTVARASSRELNGFVSTSRQSRDAAVDELVRRFEAFLAGDPVDFGDLELDLGWATPFQHALGETLRAVPRGDVVSYGELAALAGRPGAARAVGAFCAANRFAFVVPCHRVVAAHGIGGYGSAGLDVKRRLLALERVVL